ncbi:EndoU domain-containing protein [Rhodococcus sp. D2-41]|uniref:VG15 protein n=1 Tax=Speluncibacter jeojiensis TaxID=2710754 RepID=UPI00240F1490|nr:hypothetical protein [Rhodococcus sp. D2-41]MDG3012466.1 EndoU domain-containing protein [Rhodococcus sp. D2-41]
MSLAGMRAVLKAVLQTLSRQVRRLLQLYGVPVTDTQRQTVASALFPHMQRARRKAYQLGVSLLAAQARSAGITPPKPAPMRGYNQSALVTLLENATRVDDPAPTVRVTDHRAATRAGRTVTVTDSAVRDTAPKVSVQVLDPQVGRARKATVEVTERNRFDPKVVKVITDKVDAAAQRHARMPAREAISDTVDRLGAARERALAAAAERNAGAVERNAPAIAERKAQLGERAAQHSSPADEEPAGRRIGWARVLTGAENCGFCAMLASRGPVYKTKKTAKFAGSDRSDIRNPTLYHDHCDCDVVLVVEGRDWPGREQYDELEHLWITSTSGVYGKDAMRAFGKAFTTKSAAGQPDTAPGVGGVGGLPPVDPPAGGGRPASPSGDDEPSWRVPRDEVPADYPEIIGGGKVHFTPEQRPDVESKREHILVGDSSGGGHGDGAGLGKSEFTGWSDQQVMAAVDRTLADPVSVQRLGGTLYFRRLVEGVPVEARVDARKPTPTLRTAYPSWDALKSIKKGKGQVLWGA